MIDLKYCDLCGGNTYLIYKYGTLETYKCEKCKQEFSFLFSPIIEGRTEAFYDLVDVENKSKLEKRKLVIKLKRLFKGYPGFDPNNLDEQSYNSLNEWNLGIYSKPEVSELEKKLQDKNLSIKFILYPERNEV